MHNDSTFAHRVRCRLAEVGITGTDAAAAMGVSRQAWWALVHRGPDRMHPATRSRLAQALSVAVGWLEDE